jgi:hypothetical protein
MFGKREILDRAPAPVEPKQEVSALLPEIPISLRDRVIREIDPSVAATVAPDVLRHQIEEIIHSIANEQRMELSGREQSRLAEDIANDMTGYGPLRPLLMDDSINDIMVNGPANIYVERGASWNGWRFASATTTISPRLPRRSPHAWDVGSTNPARWLMHAYRMAAALM